MRLIITYTLSLFLIFTLCNESYAQESIAFGSYFFGDIENQGSDINRESSGLKTSWIEKAELRTETDEFDIARQRYAFRVTPSSRKVNQALKDLKGAYDSKLSILEGEYDQEYIQSAYKATLSAYKIDLQSDLQEQLLKVLTDQDKVYQKLLDAKNSYAVRWLDVQKEIAELQADIYENQARQLLYIDENRSIDWSSMIDINSIQESIIIIESMGPNQAADLDYTIESEILNKEMELIKAESGTFFDFIQADYKGPGDDPLSERVSVTAAFQLPMTSNKSKLKIAELHNEQAELELEQRARQAKQDADSKESYDDINILISVYNMRTAALDRLRENSKSITESYLAFNETNPLFLLQQKEMLIKEEIDIQKSKAEIIESYIDYLNDRGVLYDMPFKNYLIANR